MGGASGGFGQPVCAANIKINMSNSETRKRRFMSTSRAALFRLGAAWQKEVDDITLTTGTRPSPSQRGRVAG
jgi:hypothetical protein